MPRLPYLLLFAAVALPVSLGAQLVDQYNPPPSSCCQASAAMLLGGAVAGGRVIADWPGLSNGALYEGRDLKPTTDLDALIAGALGQHYAIEPSRVMTTLFPEGQARAFSQPLIA